MAKTSTSDRLTLFGLLPALIIALIAVVWMFAGRSKNPGDDSSTSAVDNAGSASAPAPEGWEALPSAGVIASGGSATFETPLGWEKVSPAVASAVAPPAAPTAKPDPAIARTDSPAATSSGVDGSGSDAEPEKRTFPTEERVWTNYQGQVMIASVLECDFKSGNLLMKSDLGVLRKYQLYRLSDRDREYLYQFAEKR